jgi:hypothetical protein
MMSDEFQAMAVKLTLDYKGEITDAEREGIAWGEGWALMPAIMQLQAIIGSRDSQEATEQEAWFSVRINQLHREWARTHGEKPIPVPRAVMKKAKAWERQRRKKLQ